MGTKAWAKAPSANRRRNRAGAKGAGDQDVSDQAGNAGQQGEAADGGRRTEQAHGWGLRKNGADWPRKHNAR
ncbi:hypothetical protein G6F65_018636 [Rhizopus arrhizus]|nr:hypothetical protein G6F65_018636 [Rhizopus arrhizus]